MVTKQVMEQFQSLEDRFNSALNSNNISEISMFLAPDWVMLEPQFGIVDKEQFLNVIQRGDLLHTSMKKTVLHVNVQKEIALVISRGMNIGFYRKLPFDSEQWVTNVYRKENEGWVCIMTQEAPVSCK